VQSSSQIITTNKPTPSLFYRPDALPVAQPTVSKSCIFQIVSKSILAAAKYFFPKYVPKLLLITDDTFQYPAGTA